MKILYKAIALLTLAITLLYSCSKDDSPFEGHDNHIVSFTLTANGTKFTGSIIDQCITVYVPTNVDLGRATVEYTLSENATIQPDPNTIGNWNEEQVFRVEAHNSSYTAYRYKVTRTNIVNGNNITLLTQSDVNTFAAMGINRITGNLIIASPLASAITQSDPITDLSGLSSITEVDYNIVINNEFAGESLTGLKNLKRAGGIYIGTEATIASTKKRITVSLPKLESVNNIIINTDSLTQLSIPKVTTVANLFVNSILLNSINLTALETCYGNLTLKAITGTTYSEAKSNRVLKELSLPKLHSVYGTLWIENFWQLSCLNLSALSSVNGDLQLKYNRTIKTVELPTLNMVKGDANIQANDGMVNLLLPELTSSKSLNIASVNSYSINLKTIELPKFESTSGNFSIQYAGIVGIEIPHLRNVGGTLLLSSMQFLENASFPILTNCSSVKLQAIPLLSTLNTPNLQTIKNLDITSCITLQLVKLPKTISGDVTLNGGNKICNIPIFQGLEDVNGKFSVVSVKNNSIIIKGIKNIGTYVQTSGPDLTELAFPDLDNVGDFSISGLTKVTTLNIPNLKSANNFSVKGLYLLNNVTAPQLSTITGTFTLYGGSYASQASQSIIANMDAFASLNNVGKVDIRYAGNLSDYTGLKNIISTLSAENWTVTGCKYNPTYIDMVNGKYTAE